MTNIMVSLLKRHEVSYAPKPAATASLWAADSNVVLTVPIGPLCPICDAVAFECFGVEGLGLKGLVRAPCFEFTAYRFKTAFLVLCLGPAS